MVNNGTGQTTFEKYAGQTAGNYSTLPTRDVEVILPAMICRTCGDGIEYRPDGGRYGWGGWEHTGATECTYPTPVDCCTYCGTTGEEVTFHQQAWSDETHCARCGGINGYGIGD